MPKNKNLRSIWALYSFAFFPLIVKVIGGIVSNVKNGGLPAVVLTDTVLWGELVDDWIEAWEEKEFVEELGDPVAVSLLDAVLENIGVVEVWVCIWASLQLS